MITDLFQQLEDKVDHAVEIIELLRLQIDELEEENLALKAEHEKWRSDLTALINRLDDIDLPQAHSKPKQTNFDFEDADASAEEDFISA